MLFIIGLSKQLNSDKLPFDFLVLLSKANYFLRNNTTATSGSYSKAAEEGDNDIHSEVFPHSNNPLEICKNFVEVDEESQNVFRLTKDQLVFLGMVANIVQSASMRRNSNVVPRQINVTESNKTDTWKLSGGDAEELQQLSTDCVQSDPCKAKKTTSSVAASSKET